MKTCKHPFHVLRGHDSDLGNYFLETDPKLLVDQLQTPVLMLAVSNEHDGYTLVGWEYQPTTSMITLAGLDVYTSICPLELRAEITIFGIT